MTMPISAENGLDVKPQTATLLNPYPRGMTRRKKSVYWERSKSGLQTVFVRRLVAILEDRGISDNQLADMIAPGKPKSVQRSISRITACDQDPSLEMVWRITQALQVNIRDVLPDDDLKPVRKRTELLTGSFAEQQNDYSSNSSMRNSVPKRSKSGKSR